jgi:hypothetical protein
MIGYFMLKAPEVKLVSWTDSIYFAGMSIDVQIGNEVVTIDHYNNDDHSGYDEPLQELIRTICCASYNISEGDEPNEDWVDEDGDLLPEFEEQFTTMQNEMIKDYIDCTFGDYIADFGDEFLLMHGPAKVVKAGWLSRMLKSNPDYSPEDILNEWTGEYNDEARVTHLVGKSMVVFKSGDFYVYDFSPSDDIAECRTYVKTAEEAVKIAQECVIAS